jgi:hypothetical protein
MIHGKTNDKAHGSLCHGMCSTVLVVDLIALYI